MENRTIQKNKKWIYFFDLDGTLLKSNSSFYFGRFLYKKKQIRFFKALTLSLAFLAHRLKLLSMEKLHQFSFDKFFFQKSKEAYQNLAAEFVRENKDFVVPFVYKFFQEAQENGHKCVILSSSPDFLVQTFGNFLKADLAFGSEYLTTKTGAFSNLGKILNGQEKAYLIKELCYLDEVPLSNTFAISDSILDIEFLKAANHAIVALPDKKLQKAAKHYGWEQLSL